MLGYLVRRPMLPSSRCIVNYPSVTSDRFNKADQCTFSWLDRPNICAGGDAYLCADPMVFSHICLARRQSQHEGSMLMPLSHAML
jgi:hypothetical protein